MLMLQRNSVSPADREKYRTRSPLDIENDSKRRKDEKLQVSIELFSVLALCPATSTGISSIYHPSSSITDNCHLI